MENRGKCKKTRCALCTLSSKGTIENHFYSNLPESLSILVQGILTAISIYFTIKCSGFTEFSLYKAIPSAVKSTPYKRSALSWGEGGRTGSILLS